MKSCGHIMGLPARIGTLQQPSRLNYLVFMLTF